MRSRVFVTPAVIVALLAELLVLGSSAAAVHTNHLATGQLLGRAQFYPFGQEVTPGSLADPHTCTGPELDAAFGLVDFGAPVYHPHLGRFLSTDPSTAPSPTPSRGTATSTPGTTRCASPIRLGTSPGPRSTSCAPARIPRGTKTGGAEAPPAAIHGEAGI